MKEAGIMLIIKDELILGITRRNNKSKYGLPGGKLDVSSGDKDTKDAAIRECFEETSLVVKDCVFIYERVELGDGPNGIDFYCRCYYATDWDGTPTDSEEGSVAWLTEEEITNTKAAFGLFNKQALEAFRNMYK